MLIHAIDFPFSLLNSKGRLRRCCKWRSKITADVRIVNDDSPTYKPPKSQKPQSSTNFDSKTFLSFYSFENDKKRHPRRTSNNIWQMTSLWMKLRIFWLHEIWWNSNKSKYSHLSSFARRYLLPPPSSVHSERLFSEADNLKKLTKAQSLAFKNRWKAFISQLAKARIACL